MHTEDEARTKWCPFARAVSRFDVDGKPVAVTSANFLPDENGNTARTNCIASDCMAWEWEMRSIPTDSQPPMEWVEEPTGRGDCGLKRTR